MEMLRSYGRRIVRQAVPDFASRFPHAVRHCHMMLTSYPQLVAYLDDPDRHYKPTFAFLNQCEVVYSYGDLFELASADAATDAPPTSDGGDDAPAESGNTISSALAALRSARLQGSDLKRVVARGEWFSCRPWLTSLLGMMGISIASIPEAGLLDLDALVDTFGNASPTPASPSPHEAVKFVCVFLAGVTGVLGETAVAQAKNMQIVSMVLYLFKSYSEIEKATFKREVLDPSRAGRWARPSPRAMRSTCKRSPR